MRHVHAAATPDSRRRDTADATSATGACDTALPSGAGTPNDTMAVDHEPHEAPSDAKDATLHTRDANRAVLDRLPFHNNQAYYEVRRGLLVQVKDLVIDGPDGSAWSLLGYLDQMSSVPPA